MQIDPRLLVLDQDRPPPRPSPGSGGGRFWIRSELQTLPVAGEPLDQQAAVLMPIDSGDVALVAAKVHPARRTALDRDHAQLDAGILGPGKRIAMLLDLQR